MPTNRVERIDQLAPGHRVACAAHRLRALPLRSLTKHRAARSGALLEPRLAIASEQQRDPQASRALNQKRQIETVQVVIFDHIGVELADPRAQPHQELGFCVVALASHFHRLLLAVRAAHSHQEDSGTFRVQTGRFQIELQALNGVERQLFEISATGCQQVLFLGRQRQHCLRAQLAQMRNLSPKPLPSALQHGASQRATVPRAHHVAQSPHARQFLKTDASWKRPRTLRPQARS